MYSKFILAVCVLLFIIILFDIGGVKIEHPLVISAFGGFTASLLVVELKKNNLL